jgi:hypothetical protein
MVRGEIPSKAKGATMKKAKRWFHKSIIASCTGGGVAVSGGETVYAVTTV